MAVTEFWHVCAIAKWFIGRLLILFGAKWNINIKLFSVHRIKYLDFQSYNQTGIKSLNTPLKKNGLFLSLALIIGRSHNPATVTNRFGNPNNLFLMTPVRASLEAQMVKNLPAVCEPLVRSLGSQDPLEKRMATHPSILA